MKFFGKPIALLLLVIFCALTFNAVSSFTDPKDTADPVYSDPETGIPEYEGEMVCIINDGQPFFSKEEISTEEFETYSSLDLLGRCGPAFANISTFTMPEEDREDISSVKPSGWQTDRYRNLETEDNPTGNLYNRCHLIAFSLAGENDNELNLITGTRALNEAMIPYEREVMDYCYRTGNHVLYRVTPIYENEINMLAEGVMMEAYSVEDFGEGVTFCVFVYNVQPGVVIDYLTGKSLYIGGEK